MNALLLALVLAQWVPTPAPPAGSSTMSFAGSAGFVAAQMDSGVILRYGPNTGAHCDTFWSGSSSWLQADCLFKATGLTTPLLRMVAEPLPACTTDNNGEVRRDSGNNGLYYCPGAGTWVELPNQPQAVSLTGTVAVPISLGILGIGGSTTATTTVVGAIQGSDCLATCPDNVLSQKVMAACSVGSGGVVTLRITSLSALSITLPTASCGVLVRNR